MKVRVQPQVVEHPAAAPEAPDAVVAPCSATVVDMLAQEAAEGRPMLMVDDSAGAPDEVATREPPAIDEVAILGREPAEAVIAAADREVPLSVDGEVEPGKESRLLAGGVEEVIHAFGDHLARDRDRVCGVGVLHEPADEGPWLSLDREREVLEPGGIRHAVVVQERDDRAAGEVDTGIAVARDTAIGPDVVCDLQPAREPGEQAVHRLPRRIDDDHLEGVGRE